MTTSATRYYWCRFHCIVFMESPQTGIPTAPFSFTLLQIPSYPLGQLFTSIVESEEEKYNLPQKNFLRWHIITCPKTLWSLENRYIFEDLSGIFIVFSNRLDCVSNLEGLRLLYSRKNKVLPSFSSYGVSFREILFYFITAGIFCQNEMN